MAPTSRIRHFSVPTVLSALLALAAFAAPARADLLDFTFSFSNGNGSIPGTVTGEIEGLADNSTGAAADVIVDSAPAMQNLSTLTSAPYDTASWVKSADTFTVTDGQITAADFRGVFEAEAILSLNYGSIDAFTLSGNSYSVTTHAGFDAITFTPLNAPASPEPGTFAMAALALPAFGFCAWKKRKTAAVK
jgi:hypothetical protein